MPARSTALSAGLSGGGWTGSAMKRKGAGSVARADGSSYSQSYAGSWPYFSGEDGCEPPPRFGLLVGYDIASS